MSTERAYLYVLLAKTSLSEEEKRWLSVYLAKADTPELREILLEKFADDLSEDDTSTPIISREKILERIHAVIEIEEADAPVIPFWRRRNITAACILLMAAGVFFLLKPRSKPVVKPMMAKVIRTDVPAPKTNRATIILANGQHVVLDSNNRGTLAMQGEVRIEKSSDGSISYHGTALQNVYNTLSNPRGSKPVSLMLSDGTQVWLNSESSVRYPASFTAGADRLVNVIGEVYFEVAKVPGSHFRVNVAGKGTVEVLGTHFNINSYADEVSTQVTLLEGSIQLSVPVPGGSFKQSVSIQPGQQASYSNDRNVQTAIAVSNHVDVDAVMAWKNGYFNFDNANLYRVMRQLARWYDIKVLYEGKIAEREFGGEMQRDLNLSEVLKLLEKNNVHFSIQNNELIVRP